MNKGSVVNKKIAIVGAGISGLTCGHLLSKAGAQVYCFEKSRGPGGRMSTRRIDGVQFDHGAQFFTARTPAFIEVVSDWQDKKIVGAWPGSFGRVDSAGRIFPVLNQETLWVGLPKMSAIAGHLAASLSVRYETEITSAKYVQQKWVLTDATGLVLQPFDLLILSCPGPQSARLIPVDCPARREVDALNYAPCWAVMLEYERPLSLDWDSITFTEGPLRWAARDSSKPSRPLGSRWVLHASPDWSRNHFHLDSTKVIEELLNAFAFYAGEAPLKAIAHRWRYAMSLGMSLQSYVFNLEWGVGICGDGFQSGRVESAWTSGFDLAHGILEVP